MFDLIAVPLKKPSETDLAKPLKNIIQGAYNNPEKTEKLSEKFIEFNKLRNTAVFKVFDKFETSLEVIYGYYDQLCALETKIPVHEFQVPFKYKDAFDKGTIFGGRASLTLSSIAYEKVCVLFNIAALQSSVGATQCLDSDEGLKTAAKLFQQSSGIFGHLKSAAPAAIPQEPTPDMSPETLNVLSCLMLAQAQEIFSMKAIKDNMKEAIIAKLCSQCEEMYADVLKAMQKDSLKTLWEKDWIPLVAGKQAGMQGLTMFYMSLVDRSKKQVGHEIARLQKSVDLFKAAQSRSGKPQIFEEFSARAQRNLVESKKDNDFIYNAAIPDVTTLEGSSKAQLAKVLPLGSPMSTNFKDLFDELVPVALHQAMTSCDARKRVTVNAEIMKLRESTQTLNACLASLNLPAAIETTAAGAALPPSLLEKAKAVRDKGGVESVRQLIKELPDALNRNKEILDETERILNEERDSDNQLRGQFKERWTRTPSDKLTEVFRSNCAKYREIINNAISADKVVRAKFDDNLKAIEMLSKSPSELHESIPAGAGNVSNSQSVQRLRQLMQTVETIKVERDVVEAELSSATVNMKEEFMQALAKDGAINEMALSVSSIGKVLSPLQQQAAESIGKQDQLMKSIQESHAQFTAEKGSGSNSRDTLFSQLATAYDVFEDLLHNLMEGTKFYNDLTQLLIVFQNKISDFCFARKTEKEELMKDLTTESSRQGAVSTPAIPSHHAYNPEPAPRTAPPRPAPPTPSAIPYPTQQPNMPIPYGATTAQPYPTYIAAPPMPQSFNPYATLPYPTNYQFPQGPPPGNYGTYPGNYQQQMHQMQQAYPSYPQQQPGQPQPGQPQPGQNPYGGW